MPNWEYKFVFRDNRIAPHIFDLLCGMKEISAYESRFMADQTIINKDDYFDSSDLSLESRGMVLRVRQTNGGDSFNLVLKRQDTGPNHEVIYPQTDPVSLDEGGFAALLKGEFPGEIGAFLSVLAGGSVTKHILTLEVNRKVVALSDTSGVTAILHLDHIYARLPGSESVAAEDFEVELKSDRVNFPESDVLRDYFVNAFGMIPVTRSKLRRMAPLIRGPEKGARKKVILDVDTGVDDALAVILAMNSPELEVLGITIVGGNVNAGQSARNTAAVLSVLKPAVMDRYPQLPPIAIGRSLPEGAVDASDVHGPDGLGGVCEKYLDTAVESKIMNNADVLFKQLVHGHDPDAVTLITTGPLTNAAHWVDTCPEEMMRLKEIISMGGVFFQAGNRGQASEFNIHIDPGSAKKVVDFCRTPLSSGIGRWRESLPLTFVGLDVTHRVRFRRQQLAAALERNPENRILTFIQDVTRFYMDFYYRNEGLDGCYLHDPLAVACAIDPGLCQAEQFHIEVEDKGEFTSGMAVADYRPTRLFKDKMKEVTRVCYKVDSDRFERFFRERVL